MAIVSPSALRSASLAAFRGLRGVWAKLPTSVKAGVVAAASTELVNKVGNDETAVMTAFASELTGKSAPEAVDAIGRVIAALPNETRVELRDAAVPELDRNAKEAYAALMSIAESRASATKATGDGQAAAFDGSVYEKVLAAKGQIARAQRWLGTTDPRALRELRDVMFMDEQLFAYCLQER